MIYLQVENQGKFFTDISSYQNTSDFSIWGTITNPFDLWC